MRREVNVNIREREEGVGDGKGLIPIIKVI